MKAIIRLAELLQKTTLTAKERQEGIALAEAMFGYGSMQHLDHVRVALRSKKQEVKFATKLPGAFAFKKQEKPVEKKVELAEGEFILDGDVYSTRLTKKGSLQYVKNGKLTSKAKYDEALESLNQ